MARTAILPLQGAAALCHWALPVRAGCWWSRRRRALLPRGGDGGGFADEDDSAFATPAAESEGGFDGLPAVASVGPRGSGALHLLDEGFDFYGVFEFEKIRQFVGFGGAHDAFVSVVAIAPQKCGPMGAWEGGEQFPKTG